MSSRMLETALVVLALRSVVREHVLLTSGQLWLRENHPQADPATVTVLEALYQRMALGEKPTLPLNDRRLYDEPGLLRPALLLLILGHALGCEVESPLSLRAVTAELRAITAQRDRLDLTPAASCDYLAMYVLAARLSGDRTAASEAAAVLVQSQDPDGAFGGCAATTAAAILALRWAAPQQAVLGKAMRALAALQNRDNGWAAAPQPLVDTGHALTITRDGLIAPIEAALSWLRTQQQPNGAWHEPGMTAVWSTAVVLRGLSPFRDQPDVVALATPAVQWLAAQQQDEGGWDTGIIGPAPERLAAIITALQLWAPAGRIRLDHAERTLVAMQQTHNLWRGAWSSNELVTTAVVVGALGAAHPAVRAALETVTARQTSEGGWGREPGLAASPLSTASALECLLLGGSNDARAIRRGLDWLVTQQLGNGSWRGSTELYAPAPLRHTNAAFVHAACMRAITLGRYWVMSHEQ